MYDDLLGERKREEEIVVPKGGLCYQCKWIKRDMGSEVHMYCMKIKKYVHKGQFGCMKFEEDTKTNFGIT